MMKKIFDCICIPLMLINNNVYTFVSGIVLSLSTGIITTLCLEEESFASSWHLYSSAILFMAAGALFIYVASQITSYQVYISSKQIVISEEKKSIVNDFEAHRYKFWLVIFLCLSTTLLLGTALLFLNYII